MKQNSIIKVGGNGLAAGRSGRGKRLLAAVAAILLAGGTPVFADLNDGLVAHYPLAGSADDASLYGNHATMFGSLPFIAHPPFGMAGHFVPAGASYLEIPHQPQLVLSNSFSIHFWYRPTQLLESARVLQKHVPADHTHGYTWDIAHNPADRLVFYHCWPGGPDNARPVCPIPLVAGAWHHVVYTYSLGDNTFRGYLNGSLVAEEVAQHQVVPLDTTLSILVMRDRGGYQSEGDLDEVRIYNRALSGAEIRQLAGSNCVAVYARDFASDPGWTTDDPVKLRWDSGSGTFRGTQVNTEGTYAYVDLPGFDPNRAWRLELDHRINRCDWSAGMTLGLMDSRTSYPHGAGMDFGIGDRGHATTLWGLDGVYSPAWAADVWYHDVCEYDPVTQVLSLTITDLATGTRFMQLTRKVASFPTNMTRLGMSRLHRKGSPPGASPTATVDYSLDNILLCQAQAGPSNGSPTVICPPAAVVECGAETQLTVQVSDPEGDVMVVVWFLNGTPIQTNAVPASAPGAAANVSLPGSFPLGTNTLTVGVTDGANMTSCSTAIAVVDTTAPVIGNVAACPSVLWPPNHQMVRVNIRAAVADGCSATTWRIIDVRSNESVCGRGRGNASPDWRIIGDHTLLLRAERSGNGSDRMYYIGVQGTDAAGNQSEARTVTVTVPKSQGAGRLPQPPTLRLLPRLSTPVMPQPPAPVLFQPPTLARPLSPTPLMPPLSPRGLRISPLPQ